MLIDGDKVSRWMNARKLTVEQVARDAGFGQQLIQRMLEQGESSLSDDAGARLCEVLRISPGQIAGGAPSRAIVRSAAELQASRRPIQRDGIHFYNYFSMAGPPGRVSPVVLDILCPPDRLPQLNSGHLEPAITVNLGPGDINGRWAEALDATSWQVLRANRDERDGWIVGDSYVEPSFCPHSYSLASPTPARIISYTAESNLAPLLEDANAWSDDAFEALLADVGDASPSRMLGRALERRAHDARSASRASGVPQAGIEAFLDGREAALSTAELTRLGAALGLDHRTLLRPARRHDALGKTTCSVDESRATIRPFAGYTVASLASAPHLPDLFGQFMRIARPASDADPLDLRVGAELHYMVTAGAPTLWWRDEQGELAQAAMAPDATAWLAPYVAHGWTGEGAVVRLGSGRRGGCLDDVELTSTFAVDRTLRRGRRDTRGWGYDATGGG